MAQYPIEVDDQSAIAEGLNYLLSGPAGLGQNFAGFSSYAPVYLRGSTRQPFTQPVPDTIIISSDPAVASAVATNSGPQIYNFYDISNATGCLQDGTPTGGLTRFFKLTFTTPFTTVPYQYGDQVDVQGVDPDFYNDTGYLVWSCTTTDIICYTQGEYVWPAYVSGGQVGSDWTNINLSTDCNGRVTVNGGGDRVFVSAQVKIDALYLSNFAINQNATVNLRVRVRRYKGYLDQTPGSTDYIFANPVTVSEQSTEYTTPGGGAITNSVESGEWIFTTIIDGPNLDKGYYWYILDLDFDTASVNQNGTVTGLRVYSGTKATTGSDVTYTGVTATKVDPFAFGTGLTANVTIPAGASAAYTTTDTVVAVDSGGSRWNVGDLVKITGNVIGGTTPANDLTCQVISMRSTDQPLIGDVILGVRSLSAQVVKE